MELIKVAVTGPESTGKSDLSHALAQYYHTSCAEEYAREYLKLTDGAYDFDDLSAICEGQIENEIAAISAAKEICFFDTDMLVLKIWAQYRFGRVPHAIEQAFMHRTYHLHLLCVPDLPWTPDPFRESPTQSERELLFVLYRNQLNASRTPYVEISGKGNVRIEKAIEAIAQYHQQV